MTCIGLDRALVPLRLLRDPSISLMQASQVIGTANVVSNTGTVIVNAVSLFVIWCKGYASSCVIDVFLVSTLLGNPSSARSWNLTEQQDLISPIVTCTATAGNCRDAKHRGIELHE